MFKIFRKNCCRLDVHKTWIYACIGVTDANSRTEYFQARFSSFSKDLEELTLLRHHGYVFIDDPTAIVYFTHLCTFRHSFGGFFPMPFSLSGISPSFKLSPSGCHALSGFLLQYARYLSRYGSSILFIIIHAKRNTDCPMLIIVRNADCLDHM